MPDEIKRDPSDVVKISFTVADGEMEKWVDTRLNILKEYDAGFYVKVFKLNDKFLYQVFCKASSLEHQEYKKFIFQATLKLGEEVKIR